MSDSATPISLRAIVDAHVHLYESADHTFDPHRSPTYEARLGDRSAVPKAYLPEAYRLDTAGYKVDGLVWHACLSDDVLKAAQGIRDLADTVAIPQAVVARVDSLDPGLEERLEHYQGVRNLTAVREHVGWDTTYPQQRLANRSDLLSNPAWRRGLAHLRKYDFKCVLQVFSPQLIDLLTIVRQYPNVGFTLAIMGWPRHLDAMGFSKWWKDIKALSLCENAVVDISAIECIFGMDWTETKVAPWVLSLIEVFGPHRCMFGSHLPSTKLSHGFKPLYDTYQHLARNLSVSEQDQLFRTVATDWFRVR
jgi:predicted TIM-barrel fold metal-dependent hydrolase